jgi:hypothetical protein
MPATFSINVGTITESSRKQNIYDALIGIPDNTSKLISPKDVRDAIFSSWANSSFKQTIGTASIEYIGIDSNNPDDRDIKQKIFIGKRNLAGLDIMSDDLLSSDTDIFFFNTKVDSITQSSTKISILSGTDSSIYPNSPYIESYYDGTELDFNLVNPSYGPVNIYSRYGRVAINGILFPSVAESSASASNGKILRYNGSYPDGSLVWDSDSVNISSLGATGSTTSIFGSPVLLNGYSLEFTDSNPVPLTVGGITQGSTFSNVPIVEMLDRILYPYTPPSLQFSLTNLATGGTFAEAGVTASIVFSYDITRYSRDVTNARILGTGSGITFSGISFSTLPGGYISGTVFGSTASPTMSFKNSDSRTIKNWVLQVSDDNSLAFSYSLTASLQYVNPIFCSFSSNNMFQYNTILVNPDPVWNTSNKIIRPHPGPSNSLFQYYSGSGYLIFAYPHVGFSASAGYQTSVKKIKDPNGYLIYDSSSFGSYGFTYSTGHTFSSGTPSRPAYTILRTTATCSDPGGYYEFIF